MLKEKDLTPKGTITVREGETVQLAWIKEAIQEEAANRQFPLSITDNQLKTGGLIGGSVDDCIVMSHPEHQRDYYKYALTVRRQGTMALIALYLFGNSKLAVSVGVNERSGLAGRLVGGLTGAKDKKAREDEWYDFLVMLISDVLGLDE